MRIVFVSSSTPSPVGHGGFHRTYQILCDLENIVGKDRVHFIGSENSNTREVSDSTYDTTINRRRRYIQSIKAAVRTLPRKLFSTSVYGQLSYLLKALFRFKSSFDRQVIQDYKEHLETISSELGNSESLVCVIEHSRFTYLRDVGLAHNIPVVLCPQNIEALETLHLLGNRVQRISAKFEFQNEVDAWDVNDLNLLISKSETSLLRGLGLNADYYPYLPVGELRERAIQLREKRSVSTCVKGLFLVIGSAGHRTTKDSMVWMLEQVKEFGLPADIQLIFVGSRTDELLPPGVVLDNVQTLGWAEQDVLDELSETACGVLVCQNSGFGAVTRIVEFSCANLPVVVSEHASFAMDLPPKVFPVSQKWQDWCDAMSFVAANQAGPCEYDDWQIGREFPFKESLSLLLNK